jgi:hypothetical protein
MQNKQKWIPQANISTFTELETFLWNNIYIIHGTNLKVVGALGNYSLVFVIFINFFVQLKDWVGQILFVVSCPNGTSWKIC